MRHLLSGLAVVITAVTACTSRPDSIPSLDSTALSTTPAGDSLLPIRKLLNEYSTAITDSMRTVLTDSASWANLYARIYANHGRPPSVETVDFTREMVVLVALGTRSSGGYSISIDSARTTATSLRVFVHSISPGSTCGATAALTQPVHAVALSRTALPVEFVEHASKTDCG
jgi:hypothetical protein